jgi:hypothetical protein
MVALAIDHLLVASPSLAAGQDYLAERFGVEPVFGGSHPRQGTCNALLALGEHCYLEVFAPDPAQPANRIADFLHTLAAPTLLWWAVRVEQVTSVTPLLQRAGVPVAAETAGARELPGEGGTLRWNLLLPGSSPAGNAVPFFIAWSSLTEHPSTVMATDIRLRSLCVNAPGELLPRLTAPGLITRSAGEPSLEAAFDTPHGVVTLSSPAGYFPAVGELLD